MNPRRITQSDIARKARVTQTTVSLALRGHASVSVATRRRILALAAKMGYRPDPVLASLVAYRRTTRQATFQGVLAWVTNYPTEDGWCNGQQVGYFQGAEQRAKELGYVLKTIWLRQPGVKPDRLRQILQTRGIQGLLLAPQPEPHMSVDLDWSQFSAVAFGYTLQRPQLHAVTNHQFRNMAHLIRRLHEFGYGRVGFAMPASQDERVVNNYLGGYLVEQQKLKRADRVPYLLEQQFSSEIFRRWLRRHAPQVVVTDLGTAARVQAWLEEWGWKMPQRVGIALPNVPFVGTSYAGIDEIPLLVGATAIDVVVGMIHRNERGVPAHPRYILIEGRWRDGASLTH